MTRRVCPEQGGVCPRYCEHLKQMKAESSRELDSAFQGGSGVESIMWLRMDRDHAQNGLVRLDGDACSVDPELRMCARYVGKAMAEIESLSKFRPNRYASNGTSSEAI